MELLISIPSMIALCVCIAMHITAQLLPDPASLILKYINIGLHIVMFIVILLSALPIEAAVLAYMISLFSYTLVYFIAEKKRQRDKRRLDELKRKYFGEGEA